MTAATMGRLFSRSMPTGLIAPPWRSSPRVGAEILGNDPAAAHAISPTVSGPERRGTQPAVPDRRTRSAWCSPGFIPAALALERLPELANPALVVHGRRDPFFPVGNGEALAREIPDARLLVLDHAATAIPDLARRRGRIGDARALVEPGTQQPTRHAREALGSEAIVLRSIHQLGSQFIASSRRSAPPGVH